MSFHPLFVFLIDGRDIIDFREMTIDFIDINPITNDKDVTDLFSQIICLDLHFSPRLLVQESAYFNGVGIRQDESIPQELERSTTVDDILNDQNILPLNGEFDIFGDLNRARSFRLSAVTGQTHKIDLGWNLEMTDKVGEKHKGAFQDADEHQGSALVVFRNLICQTFDEGGDLFGSEQWRETISFHRFHPVRKPHPLG